MVDEGDWHARAIVRAFAAIGTQPVAVRLAECGFDTTRPTGLVIPGFEDALPDAAFVRAIAAGTFEEVTRRLGVLHALRELAVPVWNDARAIERCVDKSTTSFVLARSGVPTPPTWAVEGRDAARAVVERETGGGPLVLKPLFGSQGRGLRLIERADDLPEPDAVQGIYYLQRFIRSEGIAYEDHRLMVCSGDVIGAMTRCGSDWITNVRRGGQPTTLRPDAEMIDLAVRAAASVGAVYAGVDLLRDRDGRCLVLEVNSMPAWRGLQHVAPGPIAARLAEMLVRLLA